MMAGVGDWNDCVPSPSSVTLGTLSPHQSIIPSLHYSITPTPSPMPTLTSSAVRRQIEAATPDPVYLLQGEDDVEKSALAGEFVGLVEDGLQAFNVDRIHAGDMTTGDKMADGVAALVDAVRTMPMMAPRRVVIVFQADALLAPKRESEAASRALEQLETLLKTPEPQTVLVLVAGTIDKRGRLYKLLVKQA